MRKKQVHTMTLYNGRGDKARFMIKYMDEDCNIKRVVCFMSSLTNDPSKVFAEAMGIDVNLVESANSWGSYLNDALSIVNKM